jgi:thiol-disulfide isomerase/thioredoxin
MKHLLVILLLFFKLSSSFSQNQYVVYGTTNFLQNGIAILRQTALPEFYLEKSYHVDTVKISDHLFTFSGKLTHPSQFRLSVINENSNHISEPFFIDSGFQKLTMDSTTPIKTSFDIGYGISIANSKTNEEYTKFFLPLFDSLNKRILVYFTELEKCDSLKDSTIRRECNLNTERELTEIRAFRDSISLEYATKNPKSSIAPWFLYGLLRKYGYKVSYQKIFDQISDYCPINVRNALELFLIDQKIKTIGRQFPLVDFINSNTSEGTINNNKYVLVEFWFSMCIPCIAQFDLLKPTYEKYKGKKFEIIAISIDAEQAVKRYKALINLKNYLWKQILDTGGVQAKLINISKYPTNFLLDSSGKIIAVDITPFVLENFLKKNL